MISLIVKHVLLLWALMPLSLFACLPHEIYVRSHNVETYRRSDGTFVKEHFRSGHCRDLPRSNYFADTSSQTFKNISPKIKKWTNAEKALVSKQMSLLPPWLAKYTVKEILRADSDGTSNPASSIPLTKTILIFDHFFKLKDQYVILHEMAHIALWDLEVSLVEEFASASGWVINTTKNLPITRTPPRKLLLPDSSESISEDFANHVEIYYSSQQRLKAHNPKSYQFIDKLIKQKEKP